MSRFLAYTLVAAIGFLLGCGFYYLGKFLGGMFRESILGFLSLIITNPEARDVFISGVVGMIIAIILAYLWAKSESY